MAMRLPRFVPLLFTLFGVMLLVSLGTWQLFRLQEKNALQQRLEQRLHEPVEALPVSPIPLDDWLYRRVRLRGHFLHEDALYLLTGPVHFRGDSGLYVLTPMQLDDGRVVLVQRGFVPQSKAEIDQRPESLTSGEVTVTAMVHAPERKPRFSVGMGNFPQTLDRSNPATRGRFGIYVDVAAIAKLLELPLEPYYLRVVTESDEAAAASLLPEPGVATISLYNPHQQYAITWYSLAVALLVVYGLYTKKKKEDS